MTRRRRIAAATCCLAAAAALAGGVTGGLHGADLLPRSGPASEAPPTSTGSPSSTGATPQESAASSVPEVDDAKRATAARAVLQARVSALRAKDKPAWMATVADPASAFGRRQAQVFDNLAKLPMGQFGYAMPTPAPALAPERVAVLGPGAWVATVRGRYSLAGYDRSPRSYESSYTFVRRPAGWRIAADTDGGTALQAWDLPGLRVIPGRTSLVIGNAPPDRMRQYSVEADRAVRRVTSVWGSRWNSKVVLVTPATTDQFAKLLRSAGDGLDQVAAVTQGAMSAGSTAQGDRVVVNPDAFESLQPLGRRVVITHELTHVAARSSTIRAVPIWLSEGMADYVGYSGLGLPRQRVASELLARVRQGKGPRRLPTAADFDPTRTRIAPTYSASWLACQRLADLFGQQRLVAFYQLVGGGGAASPDRGRSTASTQSPDVVAQQAFPKVFPVSQPVFVKGWLSYLRTLATSG